MVSTLFKNWQALSKTLTVDELFYLKEQFVLLEPNKNGSISLDNIKQVSSLHCIEILLWPRGKVFLIPPTIWPGLDEKFNGCHERFSCAWSFNIGMSFIKLGMAFIIFVGSIMYEIFLESLLSAIYFLAKNIKLLLHYLISSMHFNIEGWTLRNSVQQLWVSISLRHWTGGSNMLVAPMNYSRKMATGLLWLRSWLL